MSSMRTLTRAFYLCLLLRRSVVVEGACDAAHDASMCLERGVLDNDCCAWPLMAGCKPGFEYSRGEQHCGNIAHTLFGLYGTCCSPPVHASAATSIPSLTTTATSVGTSTATSISSSPTTASSAVTSAATSIHSSTKTPTTDNFSLAFNLDIAHELPSSQTEVFQTTLHSAYRTCITRNAADAPTFQDSTILFKNSSFSVPLYIYASSASDVSSVLTALLFHHCTKLMHAALTSASIIPAGATISISAVQVSAEDADSVVRCVTYECTDGYVRALPLLTKECVNNKCTRSQCCVRTCASVKQERVERLPSQFEWKNNLHSIYCTPLSSGSSGLVIQSDKCVSDDTYCMRGLPVTATFAEGAATRTEMVGKILTQAYYSIELLFFYVQSPNVNSTMLLVDAGNWVQVSLRGSTLNFSVKLVNDANNSSMSSVPNALKPGYNHVVLLVNTTANPSDFTKSLVVNDKLVSTSYITSERLCTAAGPTSECAESPVASLTSPSTKLPTFTWLKCIFHDDILDDETIRSGLNDLGVRQNITGQFTASIILPDASGEPDFVNHAWKTALTDTLINTLEIALTRDAITDLKATITQINGVDMTTATRRITFLLTFANRGRRRTSAAENSIVVDYLLVVAAKVSRDVLATLKKAKVFDAKLTRQLTAVLAASDNAELRSVKVDKVNSTKVPVLSEPYTPANMLREIDNELNNETDVVGQLIGLIIGSAVVLLIVCLVMYYVTQKKRKRKQQKKEPVDPPCDGLSRRERSTPAWSTIFSPEDTIFSPETLEALTDGSPTGPGISLPDFSENTFTKTHSKRWPTSNTKDAEAGTELPDFSENTVITKTLSKRRPTSSTKDVELGRGVVDDILIPQGSVSQRLSTAFRRSMTALISGAGPVNILRGSINSDIEKSKR